MSQEFKYIVRVAGRDLDGTKKVIPAIAEIKGVGDSYANAMVASLKLDPRVRLGQLSDRQLQQIEQSLKDPTLLNLAPWLMNRRKDIDSGSNLHRFGSDLDFMIKGYLDREKNMFSWRGVRHGLGSEGARSENQNHRQKGKDRGSKEVLAPGSPASSTGSGERGEEVIWEIRKNLERSTRRREIRGGVISFRRNFFFWGRMVCETNGSYGVRRPSYPISESKPGTCWLRPRMFGREEPKLLTHLGKLGLVQMEQSSLDDVLSLTVENVLERRLQTLVWKRGLAKSPYQARQLISHGHIALNQRRMTVPSYLVEATEEGSLSYSPGSKFSKLVQAAASSAQDTAEMNTEEASETPEAPAA